MSFTYAQKNLVSGKVIHAQTKEPLAQAIIQLGEKTAATDMEGLFQIELDKAGIFKAVVTYIGFETLKKDLVVTEGGLSDLIFSLNETNNLLQTATVTAGKFEKPLGEVTVSLDVIKPQLIENVNTRKVDDVLQKVPGVKDRKSVV